MAAGPGTSNLHSSEQKEIDAVWQKVQAKVLELAGDDPGKVRRMDIDDVLERLNSFQSSKNPEQFKRVRNAVSRALKCIQTVGGIVAAGVSTAFAPADTCYDALTFVISAWQSYGDMFENLAELLEKCIEFLDRLSYYDMKMDSRLTRLACQNLKLFVQICERLIHLRSKYARFLAFTRQLFLKDNNIQDLLDQMDKLSRKESLLVAAQTFGIASDSAGGIKTILEGQKEQRSKKDAKERRQAVVDALGFHNTEVGSTGDPIPTWQRTFDAHKNAIISDTGGWIFEDGIFVDWATAEVPAKPVIVLTGNTGSGKTLAMANVLRYLRRQGEGRRPTSRIVTAYFFPDLNSQKVGMEPDQGMLETASKALLWQLTTAFEAMAKSVPQVAERSMGLDGVLDLWQQLFLDNPEQRNLDTTFYVLVDGLVSNDMRTFAQLLERFVSSISDKSQMVRILWTAGPQTITEFHRRTRGGVATFTEVVPVAERNVGDIQKYIEHHLDIMSILKDSSRPGISEWRRKILDTLSEKCAGDFYKLSSSLTALAQVDLVEDIEEVLLDAGKERSEQIDAEIRRLNNTRTPKEIREINEIILWVDAGRRLFTVDSVEALLSIRYRQGSQSTNHAVNAQTSEGTSSTGAPPPPVAPGTAAALSISLLPFKQKLVEKYPLFAIADGGYVKWRSPETRDRIPPKAIILPDGETPARTSGNTSLGPQVVHEPEVAIIRHLLRNSCPPELYNRFNFDQFFDAKIGARHKEYICIDGDNAHIKIVLAYLTVMNDKKLKRIMYLVRYARRDLLWHMKQVDLSAADRDLKVRSGPLLVRLLTDACGIESMFVPSRSTGYMEYVDDERSGFVHVRADWVYSTEGVREISRWFVDSSVTKAVQNDVAIAFVKGIKEASQGQVADVSLPRAVLSHAATHLARLVYLGRPTLRELEASCQFLRGYIMRDNPETSRSMKNEASFYSDLEAYEAEELEETRNFRLDTIEAIEAWAVDALNKSGNSGAQNSNWEYQGFTLIDSLSPLSSPARERAICRARKAIEIDPANFIARLAVASQENLDDQEAFEQLSKLKGEIEAERKCVGESEGKRAKELAELLARTTLQLGNQLWALGEDDALAARTHLEGVVYGYAGPDYASVLTCYHERGANGHIVAFFDALTGASDVWRDHVQELVAVYLSDFIELFDTTVADTTQRWDVMEAFCRHVAELCEAQGCHKLVFTMHSWLGSFFEASFDDKHQILGIDRLEAAMECLRAHPAVTSALTSLELLPPLKSLSRAYLVKAFASDPGSERMEFYLGKIAGLLTMAENSGAGVAQTVMPTSSLIRYHRRYGYNSDVVEMWTRKVLLESIELLCDDDDDNDMEAYAYLYTILMALQDWENATIALLMIKWETHTAYLGQLETSQGSDDDSEAEAEDGAEVAETADSVDDEDVSGEEESLDEGFAEEEESTDGDGALDNNNAKAVFGDDETGEEDSTGEQTKDKGSVKSSSSSGTDQNKVDDSGSRQGGDDEDGDGKEPEELTWGTLCHGCEVTFKHRDLPVYMCYECISGVSFEEECYKTLKAGGKLQRGVLCKKDHRFFYTPAWDPESEAKMASKKGIVPVLKTDGGIEGNFEWAGWMALDEWKGRLRALYLSEA